MNDTSAPAQGGHALARVDVRGAALTIIAGAGITYAMRQGVTLIAPILLSVLLAYALEPFVAVLSRCRLPRTLAVFVVFATLLGGTALTAKLAMRQINAFIVTLPATARDLRRTIDQTRQSASLSKGPGPIDRLQSAATDIKATIDASAPRGPQTATRVMPVEPPFDVRSYLAGASTAAATSAIRVFAVVLLTLLLILRGEMLKRKMIAIAGPGAQKKVTHDVIKAIDRQIERYLVARLWISVIVAASTWLGLWILGVDQALVLGVIAGVLNVMPFIGPAVAVALITLAAFLQFHTVGGAFGPGAWATVVAALEGNVISPWLTSRAGELNTVAVFVSVLFWGWMWDVWGLVLAIPIMVAIKAAADHIEPLQPLGELLGR